MIPVAHHGFGEELIAYAVVTGGGAGSVLLLVCRIHVARFARWLRRQ